MVYAWQEPEEVMDSDFGFEWLRIGYEPGVVSDLDKGPKRSRIWILTQRGPRFSYWLLDMAG